MKAEGSCTRIRFFFESESLNMLRFHEQLMGCHVMSCEVKSDFDPLTSSIRKDDGDLPAGVGSGWSCRCPAVWVPL